MDTESVSWHREAITDALTGTLQTLDRSSVLRSFYLAGGTGLALQLGHRISRDLDFFSPDLFSEDLLIASCQMISGFAVAAKAPHTVHAFIDRVKVSFLGYAYPVLFPTRPFIDVAVADARDIACMKMSAIASRGAKRDFFDLYAAARVYTLAALVDFFKQKFAESRYNGIHLLKSLTYFEDAERDPDPDLLMPLTWDTVKRYFVREAPGLR